MSALDFHHRDLARRLGGQTGPVHHLDGEAQRGIKTERSRGGGDVDVDRTGNTDRVEALELELVENAHALATHDADQGIDSFCLQLGKKLIGQVHFLNHFKFVDMADVKRIDACGLAEDAA